MTVKRRCSLCPKLAQSNRSKCKKHARENSKAFSHLYHRRKAAAQCAYCGAPGPHRRVACDQCILRKRLARYKITPEDYKRLLDDQDGVCALCRQPEKTKMYDRIIGLSVDHDHRTGKVRGLLCGPCNRGIRLIDDPKLLAAAIKYLNLV